MNVNTGELRRISDSIPQDEIKKLFESFTEVPTSLLEEANKEFGDKESVFVDMQKSTPLVKWAKSKQSTTHPDGNRKHRRKMIKDSRKKNRT